ncbi:unnamed protein product [Ilex paraguariensis]|uniref:Uncharacterized protein n=1 Tax=Ilex paraguariensis TaxID=185542 RepID=A0ABC8SP49_9AQUA
MTIKKFESDPDFAFPLEEATAVFSSRAILTVQYVSMGDIIDLSALVSVSAVKMVSSRTLEGYVSGVKTKVITFETNGPASSSYIFVMTDLPLANWTGSYLAHLARDSDAFKLFVLREEDALVERTMKKVVAARRGMKFGFGLRVLMGL